MKLNNIQFDLNSFAAEMAKLKNDQHFDFLVTIVGEDFRRRRTRLYLYFRKHLNTRKNVG